MGTIPERIHRHLGEDAQILCDDCVADDLLITVSIRGRPLGGSPFLHEVRPALVEELVEVVEAAAGEGGGGLRIVV